MHIRTCAAIALSLLLSSQTFALQVSKPPSCSKPYGEEYARKGKVFLQELKSAVAAKRYDEIADAAKYPLSIYHNNNRQLVSSREELIPELSRILNDRITKLILDQADKCLFANGQGTMIAKGSVWFQKQTDGSMKIITINIDDIY